LIKLGLTLLTGGAFVISTDGGGQVMYCQKKLNYLDYIIVANTVGL